jgi:glycosyltransferase involved in cell wall biosynthesis
MKLGFVTTFNIHDLHKRSGTPHYMAKAMEQAGMDLEYIGPLKMRLPAGFKIKNAWKKFACGQQDSTRFNTHVTKQYAKQVAQQISGRNLQALVAHILNPVAYLDCKEPIVLWTDAVYAALIGFYPGLSYHSSTTIREANEMTAASLERCSLALFSSDWAARSAMELYGASKEKIKVVSFGANIDKHNTLEEVRDMLKTRPRDKVKLLFLGKEWYRKGGDIVLNAAKALHAAGQPVELNIVGCQPPSYEEIPPYVNCLGYISKRTPEGMARISNLLGSSHFLFLPSRAEACAIAFCEASAFGLPTLTSYVGGIPTVIKDNINGMKFALDADPKVYCDYIMNLMQNYSRYEEMALASFHEYDSRLNWRAAALEAKKLIAEIL